MTGSCAERMSADAQGGELNSTQIWLRSCEDLVPPMQGEAAPYRLLSDEVDPAQGLEQLTPVLEIAIGVFLSMPLCSLVGFMAWAMLR